MKTVLKMNREKIPMQTSHCCMCR